MSIKISKARAAGAFNWRMGKDGRYEHKVNSVEYMPQEEANSQYGSELLPDNGNNSNTYYL